MPTTPAPTTEPISDLRLYLENQLASGASRIVVPPGVYRLTPVNRHHLIFSGVSNVELVMAHVELICTQTTRAITIQKSQNLTIVGPLTVDYDPLPFTQGRIVGLSDDYTVHDIELDPGYLSAEYVDDHKYEIFRADTRTLRFGSYYSHAVNTSTGSPTRIQIVRDNPDDYEGEQVGDLIAITAGYAPDGSIPHAIVIDGSTDITFQEVTLYTSNMFGFFEKNCQSNRYIRCRCDRRSVQSDLVDRPPRIRSLNGDAFHSKYATIGPALVNCTGQFMADDGFNVNGDYHMVMSVQSGNVLRVLSKVHGLNIQTGDPLEILDYEGRRLPNVVAIDVSDVVDTISDAERDFVSQQRLHAGFKADMTEIHYITIDRSLNGLPRGSLLGSENRMGNGVSVTGCRFGYNRSRGIIIKASQATVKNNMLEGIFMQAIKVASEYWWLEAGSSNNVLIDGNHIRDGHSRHSRGITAYAYTGKGYRVIAPAGAHHNITIQNNIIENVDDTHIWVTSTDGLVLSNNTYDSAQLLIEECANVQGVGIR